MKLTIFLAYFFTICYCDYLNDLVMLSREFQIKNPHIISSNKVLNSRPIFKIIKHFMNQSHFVYANSIVNTTNLPPSAGLVIQSDIKFMINDLIDISHPWIIFCDDSNNFYSKIDQPVYFYNNNGSLWERYQHKTLKVHRNLGIVQNGQLLWDYTTTTKDIFI